MLTAASKKVYSELIKKEVNYLETLKLICDCIIGSKNKKNIKKFFKSSVAGDILASDKARATYYSIIANKNWGDKCNYDLCIDSKIGNENVVKIISDYINNK